GVARRADDRDDPVDRHDREAEALDDLPSGPGFTKVVEGPAGDDLPSVADEDLERLAQAETHGPAVDDGEGVDAEARLERRHLVQVVEDDLVVGVALELEHDPDAGAVALVADVRDSLEALVTDQIGGRLDPPGLVHHERDLGDDDRL